jgi:hypothetical protein
MLLTEELFEMKNYYKDEAIETLMLAVSYEGRVNYFSPKS